MKINYIHGNLMDSPYPILHGCNASGVAFASGVAGHIRKIFPYAYQAYINAPKPLQMGGVIEASDPLGKGPLILNGITQNKYGTDKSIVYADYDAIRSVIRKANDILFWTEFTNISLPLIGAGLANGSWKIISEIIEEYSVFTPNVYLLDGLIPNT